MEGVRRKRQTIKNIYKNINIYILNVIMCFSESNIMINIGNGNVLRKKRGNVLKMMMRVLFSPLFFVNAVSTYHTQLGDEHYGHLMPFEAPHITKNPRVFELSCQKGEKTLRHNLSVWDKEGRSLVSERHKKLTQPYDLRRKLFYKDGWDRGKRDRQTPFEGNEKREIACNESVEGERWGGGFLEKGECCNSTI